TNIHGHDEDLEAGRVLRFSKHGKWHRFHRFQHFYSIFFYGLLTFNWFLTTCFFQTKRYLGRKVSFGKLRSPFTQWCVLVISKIIYVLLWIVIPLVSFNSVWWKILLGFFIMHYVAGLILSIVFRLAQVVEDTDTMLPHESGT